MAIRHEHFHPADEHGTAGGRPDAVPSLQRLTLAERVFVSALRISWNDARNGGEERERLADLFATVVAPGQLGQTLQAYRKLADGLRQGSRWPLRINPLSERQVSADEATLLRIVSAWQQGKAEWDWAATMTDRLIAKAAQPAFIQGAAELARIFCAAAHYFFGIAMQRHDAAGATAKYNVTAPSMTDFRGLTPSERVVVTGMREWVGCYQKGQDGLAVMVDHFADWGVPNAGYSLDAVLNVTVIATIRRVDVRCVKCPGLSPDEARLLDAVAALQHGVADGSQIAVAGWLPQAALRIALESLRGLAFYLLQAQLLLPPRVWDFIALERRQAPAADPDPDRQRPVLH